MSVFVSFVPCYVFVLWLVVQSVQCHILYFVLLSWWLHVQMHHNVLTPIIFLIFIVNAAAVVSKQKLYYVGYLGHIYKNTLTKIKTWITLYICGNKGLASYTHWARCDAIQDGWNRKSAFHLIEHWKFSFYYYLHKTIEYIYYSMFKLSLWLT